MIMSVKTSDHKLNRELLIAFARNCMHQADNEHRPEISRAFSRIADGISDLPSNEVSHTMVREALAHAPMRLTGYERWEWIANFLNEAMRTPHKVCKCCGVTMSGESVGDP